MRISTRRVALVSLSMAVAGTAVAIQELAFAQEQAAQKKAATETPKPGAEPTKPAEAKPAEKPAEKPAAEQKPAVPPAPNPLQNLFRRLLPNPAPQPAVPRGAATPAQKPIDPEARDHIDARAPKDRRQAEILRKANAAIGNEDWTQALELLQNVLGQPEDSVDRTGLEPWGSVRERAMRLMLKLPDDVVRTYRQRWSNEAQRRLDEAEQSGRADLIAQVATKFLLTDAGQTAANRLATWHVERGEFTSALRWFRWLLDMKSALAAERAWQLKVALVARQAGDKSFADRLRGDEAETEQVEFGSTRLPLRSWWDSASLKLPQLPPLTEWPLFLGTASRAGIAAGGQPLLLPRWKSPLTQIQPLQRQIEMLVEDCHDQGRATMTVSQPLLLHGLVAVRTLGGVEVHDLERGRMLWTSAERWPAETLIGNGNNGGSYQTTTRRVIVNGGVARLAVNNVSYDFSGVGIDQNPLAQLLFFNGNFGQLSSDGRQLFVVEDDTFATPVGNYYYGNDMSRMDPLRRSWTANKLVSYDLLSGRPLWSVGGVESAEAFQPELPGVFFFGAPVTDGNDLFVIGERDSEVRLFCLQAQSGQLQWTQLLAVAESPISKDLVRRMFSAQAAMADGLIVCPTTVGWLVAVDRASRQLRWVHRYSTPQPNNVRRSSTQSMTQFVTGNMRWCPSVPVISGDSVVYTPQELLEEQTNRTAQLICLNLQTGARKWSKSKDTWLALNGVVNDKVLLVGTQGLTALNLSDGVGAWATPLANGDGLPSGLGAVTPDQWHVPLSSGQVWTLSLKDGSVASRQWGAPGTMLGNLALYRGSVVSSHATGVACFEQRDSILEKIRKLKERDPLDAQALLTEASMLQLERKSPDAWKILKQIREESVPDDLRPQHRSMMRDVLTAVVERQPAAAIEELGTLERLIESPQDRMTWRRLQVESLRGRGEQLAALDLLLEMSRGDWSGSLVLATPMPRTIQLSAWLPGEFADLWNSVAADARAEIDRRIAAETQRLSSESPEALRRALVLFGFHPTVRDARWRLIEEQIAQRDFTQAELSLIRLTESNDARDAARAWQRLIELYRSLNLADDAAVAGQRLKQLGDVELADGVNAAAWVAQQIADGKLAAAAVSRQPDWSELAFRMERTVGSHNYNEQLQDYSVPDTRWPYFHGERLQYHQVHSPIAGQRLALSRLPSNQLDWSLPLRQKTTSNMGWGVAIRSVGHQMLVFHREVLHMLSPVDQRVVWTRATESRGPVGVDPMQLNRRIPQPFQNSPEFLSRPADVADDATRNALLTMLTPDVVAYRGRRMLTVIDAATGEPRWELQDVPPDTRFLTTADAIYLSSARSWPNGLLLRATDGRELPLDDVLREKLSKAKLVRGHDLVSMNRVSDGGKEVIQIDRWNPQRRQIVWKQNFATSDQFSWTDQHTLAALGNAQSLQLLDLDSGERRTLGTATDVAAGANQQRYLIGDNERVFLIFSGPRTSYYGDEFVAIPVNGSIHAFDRIKGGELWKQNVGNQSLVMQQFGVSPVLFFSSRRYEQRNKVHTQITSLLLLDKRTGRKLFDESFPNQFSGNRGLNLNLVDRQIEILTYNDRIRLVGSDRAPANKVLPSGSAGE